MPCRTLLFAVVALLVAPSLATAASPTRASWAAAANTSCATVNAYVRSRPAPQTVAQLILFYRDVLAKTKPEASALASIPAPAADRPAIARLVAILRLQNREVEHQLIPAFVRREQAAVESVGALLVRQGSRFNAIARSLGARVCAENPSPGG
jgi:hypothetical protein